VLDLSRPWHELPIVVIDVETTGIGDDARVVDVAAVRFEAGLPVARFSSLVNPGVPIPAEATAVHGVTDEMVAGAPILADALNDGSWLRVCKWAVPCAYNAPFDRRFIEPELVSSRALDITYPVVDTDLSWIDPLVLVKHFDRYEKGKGRHKLEAACLRHGVEMTGAHRAEADALACGGLLWAFKPKLGNVSAATLIRRCDERRVEQEADYQRWKASQPKECV
jgi:DNA polymerase-3 subunit epsilon